MYLYTLLYDCSLYVALVITDDPVNVAVCSETNANISCGFTGVSDPLSTFQNWCWRIIKRNNDGYVISNEIVKVLDINANKTDGLTFFIIANIRNNITSANSSYLSVGPVDDTYNNTSYQCIFTINDTIIESDTAGTVTVIGKYVIIHMMLDKECIIYTHVYLVLSVLIFLITLIVNSIVSALIDSRLA